MLALKHFIFSGKNADQQGEAFQITCRDPELVSVVIVGGKDVHPFVGKGVEPVEKTDKQVADADKQKIAVPLVIGGIDRNYENRAGDNDAESFSKVVERQVVNLTGEIEADRCAKQ